MTIKLVLILVFLLLILIFFRKWLLKLFRLLYLSSKYGKFSHEFISYFKENNLVSPYNTCIKDQITSHFLIFNKQINHTDEFQTEIPIDFDGIPFMVTSKNLIQRKGNPDCINVATLSDFKFMVMGYSEFMLDLKMKAMFFFLDDHFIMGEFSFSEGKSAQSAKMIETISSKYLNGNPIGKEFFFLKDKDGNQLNFENNGFTISIKYLFRGDHTTNMILSGSYSNGDNLSE